MTQRLIVAKPDMKFFQLMERAPESSFCVVSETGPTSFTIADETRKYKVSIGHRVTWSCSKVPKHCIHVLFVLMKIFRVPPGHHILWQLSLLDSEVDWILENRYNPVEVFRFHPRSLSQDDAEPSVKRHKLKDEEGCPICYEEIKRGDNITYCKSGCGHNLHVKCMKIWASHKK